MLLVACCQYQRTWDKYLEASREIDRGLDQRWGIPLEILEVSIVHECVLEKLELNSPKRT